MQNDIETALVQWGKWSRGGSNLEVKNMWLSGGASSLISDDEALRVDAAVAALSVHDAALGDLVKLHYVRKLGQLGLQDRLGFSRHMLDKKMAEARGFVVGFLDCRSRAA